MKDWIKEKYLEEMPRGEESKKTSILDRLSYVYEKKVENDNKIVKELKENFKNSLEIYNEYLILIKRYSTFDIEVISPILAEIISLYIGKKTIYERHSGYHVLTEFGFYSPLYFAKYNFCERNITFYDVNILVSEDKLSSQLFVEKSCVFRKYPFLIDFIDYLVQYRMVNNKEIISEDELKELERKYVIEHLDEIRKIHDVLNETFVNELNNKHKSDVSEVIEKRKSLIKSVLEGD